MVDTLTDPGSGSGLAMKSDESVSFPNLVATLCKYITWCEWSLQYSIIIIIIIIIISSSSSSNSNSNGNGNSGQWQSIGRLVLIVFPNRITPSIIGPLING